MDRMGIEKPDYLYDLEKYRKHRERSSFIVMVAGLFFLFYGWVAIINYNFLLNTLESVLVVSLMVAFFVLLLVISYEIFHTAHYHYEDDFKEARQEAGIEKESIV